MKTNILTLPTPKIFFADNQSSISIKNKSSRQIDFVEDTSEKIIGSYTHHPFVDGHNFLYGAFSKDLPYKNKVILNKIIESYRGYCLTRIGKKISTLLPGYYQKDRCVDGFKFEFWKSHNSRLIRKFMKKIEIDFIGLHQISFVVREKAGDSFFPNLQGMDKGPINYKKLIDQHINFLEERVRKHSCGESMEKLEKYLKKTNIDKLKYYVFIKSLHGI